MLIILTDQNLGQPTKTPEKRLCGTTVVRDRSHSDLLEWSPVLQQRNHPKGEGARLGPLDDLGNHGNTQRPDVQRHRQKSGANTARESEQRRSHPDTHHCHCSWRADERFQVARRCSARNGPHCHLRVANQRSVYGEHLRARWSHDCM